MMKLAMENNLSETSITDIKFLYVILGETTMDYRIEKQEGFDFHNASCLK